MNFVTYLSFLLFINFIALLPFRVMYGFSYVLYFFLYHIIGYRRKTTLSNLKKAFPSKDGREIKRIASGFYKHLANIMVESAKGYTMDQAEIIRRHKVKNPEILNEYFNEKKNVIVVTGHYGNWEWGSLSGGLQLRHHQIVFYQPLSNPLMDRFLKKNRSKCNTTLVPADQPIKAIRNQRNEPLVIVMVADQSPAHLIHAYWIDFLGISTAFIHGPERLARIYDYPVFYADFKPLKQGFYEVELIPLVKEPSALPDGEITAKFVSMLGQKITEHPEYWIWSHKRWKRTKKDIRYKDYKHFRRDYRDTLAEHH